MTLTDLFTTFLLPGRGLHDPAGLCWWNGYYHFFDLKMGGGWGRHHAVSKDLVHWRDLPLLPPNFKGGTGQALADSDHFRRKNPRRGHHGYHQR